MEQEMATEKAVPHPQPGEAETQRVNELLDDALEATFPASDPVAIVLEKPKNEEAGPDKQR
jgi:hypothetical protein